MREKDPSIRYSKLGMGTHYASLGPEDAQRLAEGLRHGLHMGVDSFDTAHNYGGGKAEALLGKTLEQAQKRDVFVSTKVGFVDAPQDFVGNKLREELAHRYESLSPLLIDEMALGRHSLNPSFVSECIETSIQRLRGKSPDRILVHNPETQLVRCSLGELETQLSRVFQVLEESYRSGGTGGYGLASWQGFILPSGERYHLPLERLVSLARRTGGNDNGLKTIMLPLHPGLPDAVTRPTQRIGNRVLPIVSAAMELDLEVCVAAPFGQGTLTGEAKANCMELLARMVSDPGIERVFAGMRSQQHINENVQCTNVAVDHTTGGLVEWFSSNLS